MACTCCPLGSLITHSSLQPAAALGGAYPPTCTPAALVTTSVWSHCPSFFSSSSCFVSLRGASCVFQYPCVVVGFGPSLFVHPSAGYRYVFVATVAPPVCLCAVCLRTPSSAQCVGFVCFVSRENRLRAFMFLHSHTKKPQLLHHKRGLCPSAVGVQPAATCCRWCNGVFRRHSYTRLLVWGRRVFDLRFILFDLHSTPSVPHCWGYAL